MRLHRARTDYALFSYDAQSLEGFFALMKKYTAAASEITATPTTATVAHTLPRVSARLPRFLQNVAHRHRYGSIASRSRLCVNSELSTDRRNTACGSTQSFFETCSHPRESSGFRLRSATIFGRLLGSFFPMPRRNSLSPPLCVSRHTSYLVAYHQTGVRANLEKDFPGDLSMRGRSGASHSTSA